MTKMELWEENIWSKQVWQCSDLIADFDLEILFKVSTHLTLLKSLCGRNMSELGLGVRIYGPDKKKVAYM